MSKLNIKVVDMENSVIELAKKVSYHIIILRPEISL